MAKKPEEKKPDIKKLNVDELKAILMESRVSNSTNSVRPIGIVYELDLDKEHRINMPDGCILRPINNKSEPHRWGAIVPFEKEVAFLASIASDITLPDERVQALTGMTATEFQTEIAKMQGGQKQ